MGEDPQYQSFIFVCFYFLNFINVYRKRERETERETDQLYDVKYKILTYSENQGTNFHMHSLECYVD